MKNDVKTTLAERMAFYLDRMEMSNAELARKIGVTQAVVGQWKSGKHSPRMDKVDKMCEVFRCTRSELLDHDTSPGCSEKVLLELFRSLDNEDKAKVMEYLTLLSKRDLRR